MSSGLRKPGVSNNYLEPGDGFSPKRFNIMVNITKRILPPIQCRFRPTDEQALGFGDIFSDHMFRLNYYGGRWNSPCIEPYGPLSLEPAAMGLHYGQLIFEGLKCYRRQDGQLALFRPLDNFIRLNRSAKRVCIPTIDPELALQATLELVQVDHQWVPGAPGTSLYIRPFVVATEPHLGVRPALEYVFLIITSPVGAYYPEGFAPIPIYVESKYSRVAPGGTGEAKTASNYAASLLATEEAKKQGYSQLLWLDSCQHKYIEEVGSMHMFFIIDGQLHTPSLEGTILPGITRDSVLTLARQWELPVSERLISIEELREAIKKGRLSEAFGTGTAAVISPVGKLYCQGEDLVVGDGQVGPITRRFYDEITGIQYGTRPDTHGWVTLVPSP